MEKQSGKKGAKRLILEFFLENIGRVIEGSELREASLGKSEWARRIRELRDEQGYQILSHKDRAGEKVQDSRIKVQGSFKAQGSRFKRLTLERLNLGPSLKLEP